jgi:hypothetical protein
LQEGEPGDVPGHVVCLGQVEELAGRLPVDGHGVVAAILVEQRLQRRCDVGAVLDQARRAGAGLTALALGAVAAEEPVVPVSFSWSTGCIRRPAS